MRRVSFSLAAPIFLAACEVVLAQSSTPKHLQDVQTLLKTLGENSYQHGEGVVTWPTAAMKTSVCKTDCSGLANHLFGHSYGWDGAALKRWLGEKRPHAALYYDNIKTGKLEQGFTEITRAKDARPGDFLSVKYVVRRGDTGHLMIVQVAPKKITAQPPIKAGLDQWQVTVIDCTKDPHGAGDSRDGKPLDKGGRGLGRGTIRLYTDPKGKVAGWTWSLSAHSRFIEPKDEPLAIGRLKAGFKP